MIINVGTDTTRNILAAIDVPILQQTPAIVYGLCNDDSFSCGYDRQFEHYITDVESRNLSRYTGNGGVMYYENVHLMRVHFPYPYKLPTRFMKEILQCIKQTCINQGLDSRIIELNYLTVNNKKVIGCAWIESQDAPFSSVLISLNLKPFNFNAMLDAYKFKKLKHLGDLSEEDLPNDFIDTVARDLGSHFNIESSDELDQNILTTLHSIHNSDNWIREATRFW